MSMVEDLREGRVSIAADVRWNCTADGGVLLDIAHGTYFSLNEMGAFIWQQLAAGESTNTIVDRLGEAYALPRERVREDLSRYLRGLVSKGLVTYVD
jgi:hypothetical protein